MSPVHEHRPALYVRACDTHGEPLRRGRVSVLELIEEEELVRAKASPGAAPEVTPDIASRIQALRSGGKPLPASERAFFEPRFGHDFSGVRFHTDAHAAEAARAVIVRAFTVGRDVTFGAGQYAPETNAGRLLLGHELTHVVQQGGASMTDRSRAAKLRMRKNNGDIEAKWAADHVMWKVDANIAPGTAATPEEESLCQARLQRQVDKQGSENRRRKRRRWSERKLRELATWPADGLSQWKRLGKKELNAVLGHMIMRYGYPFAESFLKYASRGRKRDSGLTIAQAHLRPEVNAEWLEKRGYRRAGSALVPQGRMEYWVHPTGEQYRWFLDTRKGSVPAAGGVSKGGVSSEGPPQELEIVGIKKIDPLADPENVYGPELAFRKDANLFGSRGHAILYRDGTIEFFSVGSTAPFTCRPIPGSIGYYGFYEQNGEWGGSAIRIDVDAVFGKTR